MTLKQGNQLQKKNGYFTLTKSFRGCFYYENRIQY